MPILFHVKTTCKNYNFDKKKGIFQWTPLTSDPCRLQFHALRSTIKDVVSQEYWPSVHFCDCENGGQCNFDIEPSMELKENEGNHVYNYIFRFVFHINKYSNCSLTD